MGITVRMACNFRNCPQLVSVFTVCPGAERVQPAVGGQRSECLPYTAAPFTGETWAGTLSPSARGPWCTSGTCV